MRSLRSKNIPTGSSAASTSSLSAVNWQDKAQNLREIAEELNLGLDSFVFLDDSPFEREWVSSALPEVLVPELPSDPVDRIAFLRAATTSIGQDHRDRPARSPRSYQAARMRDHWKSNATSFDDFLQSLELELEVAPLSDTQLARCPALPADRPFN